MKSPWLMQRRRPSKPTPQLPKLFLYRLQQRPKSPRLFELVRHLSAQDSEWFGRIVGKNPDDVFGPLLANLKKKDEIITSGGLYGRVMALADDVVTVEIAPNVRVRVSRPQIATVLGADKVVAADKEKEKPK